MAHSSSSSVYWRAAGSCGSGFVPCSQPQELPIFPLGTLSSAEGQTGTRRWYLPGTHDLKSFLREVCASHWPDQPDCVPISVQYGAPDNNVKVFGNVKNISNELPTYDQYMIVAQYKLLHISDPWPITGKPSHPTGTTLTLQIKGGGEMLQIDPTGMAHIAGVTEQAKVELAPTGMFNNRIRIPLTEYHITCDRLTNKQLVSIMRRADGQHRAWRDREGTLNADLASDPNGLFMNELEGTLLFDTWSLEPSFAPDVDDPHRWKLSCVIKCRDVPDVLAAYPDTVGSGKLYAVGWNHDYKRDSSSTSHNIGWMFIMMAVANGTKESGWTPHGACREGFVPRYPYRYFWDLFCDSAKQGCENDIRAEIGNARAREIEESVQEIRHYAGGAEKRRRKRFDEMLASSGMEYVGPKA